MSTKWVDQVNQLTDIFKEVSIFVVWLGRFASSASSNISREKGEKSHSVEKVDPSALEWLFISFYVRGFECVENEVLSTYGKSL